MGGPVKQDAALCLGVCKHGVDVEAHPALRPVDGRVVLVDLDADPESLENLLEGVRIFAGYAGWIGQLDDELDRFSWMLASALPRDVLAPPGTDVWFDVLRRQPWPLPLLATHPIDLQPQLTAHRSPVVPRGAPTAGDEPIGRNRDCRTGPLPKPTRDPRHRQCYVVSA